MKFFNLSSLIVILALSACATTPLQPPPASHPASPAATEAPMPRRATSLTPDEATQMTNELLKGAEPAPTPAMGDMPGMNH